MHWSLVFVDDRPLDAALASRILFFLVSRGARYRTDSRRGSYMIYPHGEDTEPINEAEHGVGACTERLGDIIDQYREFDIETTSFSVSLDFGSTGWFPVTLIIRPPIEKKSSRVELRTHKRYVPDMEAHDAFVHTVRDLFDRFGFVYGSYTNEHQPGFATHEEALLDRPLQAITFYDADLADHLGRDRLLSIPAGHTEELSTGGVFSISVTTSSGAVTISKPPESSSRTMSRSLSSIQPTIDRERLSPTQSVT